MADGARVLVLCGHRRKFQDMMNERDGDMSRLLVVDRLTLLPPTTSPLAGVLVMPGASDELKTEAATRFPGLPSVEAAFVIPEPDTEEEDADAGD